MANELVKIKGISKRNGLTFTLGSLLLLGLVILFSGMGTLAKIPTYFLVVVSLAGVFIGIVKLKEPEYSLVLDKKGIRYLHARGSWFVPWQDIQRIDIPTVDQGLDKKHLPYVALRLKSQVRLLDTISLRLASYLVTEQREIAIAALKQDFDNWQCADGSCPSEVLYRFEDYETEDKVYKGLRAMLGHRLEILRDKLGYDVYIPASALDREPNDFVGLLRRLQASV